LTGGRTVLSLVPKPQWNLDMGSSASGQGLYALGHWFLADRHGTIRSIGSDGVVQWSRSLATLSGIAGNPALCGDRIVAVTMEGLAVFLDAATGTEQGKIQLSTAVAAGPELSADHIAILGANDVVHIASVAKQALSSSIPLFARATTPLFATPGGWVVGTSDGCVICIDHDGNVRWRSMPGETVDTLRVSDTGACLAFAGLTVRLLDRTTGVVTASKEFKGTVLPEEGSPGSSRLWVANGRQLLAVNMETLAVDETIAVIRSGAGARPEAPGIDALVQHLEITPYRERAAEALAQRIPGLHAADVLACPYALIGTEAEVATELREHHERWGITRFTVRPDAFDAAARLVKWLRR